MLRGLAYVLRKLLQEFYTNKNIVNCNNKRHNVRMPGILEEILEPALSEKIKYPLLEHLPCY